LAVPFAYVDELGVPLTAFIRLAVEFKTLEMP
jgi:hypothetical protein